VEFHLVFTSSTSSLTESPATSHWRENFSRRWGEERIFTTSLRSYII